MKIEMLKAKVKVKVTSVDKDRHECLRVDGMGFAFLRIARFEKVTVLNLTKKIQFETFVYYPVEDFFSADSKQISLNGEISLYGDVGDEIVIKAYTIIDENDIDFQMQNYHPKVQEINYETGELEDVNYNDND